MQTTINRICYVAGNSAGHIIPALTLAKKEKNKIIFIAADKELDRKILDKENWIEKKEFLKINRFKIFYLLTSFFKSLKILRNQNVKKVVTTAGIIAIPVCLAAKILGIPFEIWELNLEPGKATKFLARLSTQTNICFSETQNHIKRKCHLTHYPVRFNRRESFDKSKLGLKKDKKTIVVLGGSQGSISLNQIIKNLALRLNDNFQIIHQTGSFETFDYSKFYKENNVTAFVTDYYDKIEDLYNSADIIICRSGAGSLAEACFFKKPCITIPLKAKTTLHQVENAKAFASKSSSFRYLEQDVLEKDISLLVKEIEEILNKNFN